MEIVRHNYTYNQQKVNLLKDIQEQLLSFRDTEQDSLQEILHYYKEFSSEIDFNLAQWGNLLIYYYDVRECFKRNGFINSEKMSDDRIWKIYREYVGICAKHLLKDNKLI